METRKQKRRRSHAAGAAADENNGNDDDDNENVQNVLLYRTGSITSLSHTLQIIQNELLK